MKKLIPLFYFLFLFITNLTQAQTAVLWGMTPGGGYSNYNGGVIFKMNVGGTNFDTVYSFNPLSGGDYPEGSLVLAPNGKLYGTTFYAGVDSGGTIFSYDPDSNIYRDVHDFSLLTGYQSNGSLIVATNGYLYGMATGGGANDSGAIYRFNIDSNTYKDVYDFDNTHGAYPYGDLLQGSNGKLYGITFGGGTTGNGVLFSFDPSTNNISVLVEFDGTNGSLPYGNLIQSGNKLFGVTPDGGLNGDGVIFNYDVTTNIFTKLYDFNSDSGGSPDGSLTLISNGTLYGTTYSGGTNSDGVIFSYDTLTNTYHDVFNFDGANGLYPPANLLLASDGNLYGMTQQGGIDSDGIIFEFDPTNSNCVDVHDFNGIEGSTPNGSLIEIGSTGIQQLAINNEQLLIYPNPASNQLSIISKQLSISEIRVTNIVGQTVYAFTLPTSQYSKQIDVSALLPGMYLISIISENETTTEKLIVTR